MADMESDYQVDGRSIYSLRVVDLKQELKKRDIPFKTNATKAQLQSLLIQHLSQTIDAIEDKSSEDNSRMTPQSEDTNETIESNSELINVSAVGDSKPQEEQTEATDLTQDTGITSSVSFGDRQSIKLTIKLGPNDSPTKQLSPKKSPIKEMKSPIVVEEVKNVIEEKQTKPSNVIQDIPPIEDHVISQTDSITKVSTEEVIQRNIVEQSPQKSLQIPEEVSEQQMTKEIPKTDETIQSIPDNETSKPTDLSSDDSKKLKHKSEEKSEKKDSIPAQEQIIKEVVADDIVINEDTSEELIEQKTEISIPSPEKKSIHSIQSISEDKTKNLPSDESLTKNQKQIEEKSIEKENKIQESVPKEEKVRPPRRRRWGGSATNDSQTNTRKGISSEQLKELIPDLNSTDNSSTASKVSKSDSIVVTSSLSRTQTTEEITEIPPKRDIRVVRKSVSVPEEEQTTTEEAVKTPQKIVEQKTRVVETEPEAKGEVEESREMSPPRNAASNVVFIRNLVRPFTLLQLKEVLGKTGKLVEERFWIDKIKSKCFATYETNEEAVATRLALHGTRWPASNPKLLSVDFSTKEELDSHLVPELNKDLNNKKIDTEVNQKYDIVIRSEEQRNVLREKENRTDGRPIREWDREKLVNKEEEKKARRRPNSPITRSRSKERDPKRRRIGEERVRPADSTSEEAPAAEVKRTESPAKLLDDLFRKTSTTPSIYWLPLTEEQALARVAIREEEEKKRIEERTAREEQFRKRQEERRPFDASSPPFRNERNQWRPNSPPIRREFGRRGSPPRRSPLGRRSPPRRRSPVNRFSRSRSRSPFARRKR